MLGRSLFRAAGLMHPCKARRLPNNLPVMMHQVRSYAAPVTIKVPPMAESISEGTLKQFTKQVGEFVQLDEEIATIETDKVSTAAKSMSIGLVGD